MIFAYHNNTEVDLVTVARPFYCPHPVYRGKHNGSMVEYQPKSLDMTNQLQPVVMCYSSISTRSLYQGLSVLMRMLSESNSTVLLQAHDLALAITILSEVYSSKCKNIVVFQESGRFYIQAMRIDKEVIVTLVRVMGLGGTAVREAVDQAFKTVSSQSNREY